MLKKLRSTLIAFLLFFSSVVWGEVLYRIDQLQTQYELVVSGAGPGGLVAAVSAIAFGQTPASQVLVVEKREPGFKLGDYGTRDRVVVLDDKTIALFKKLGVELPGVSFTMSQADLGHGQSRYIPNSGIWKEGVALTFGGRGLERLARLSDIERVLKEAYLRVGGKIIFGQTMEALASNADQEALIKIGNQVISSKVVAVFEGRDSRTFAVSSSPVMTDTTSHFLTYDLRLEPGSKVESGHIVSSLDASGAMIYAFASRDFVSTNLMLPPEYSHRSQDSAVIEYFTNVLTEFAWRYGLNPSHARASTYSGLLTHRDYVVAGRFAAGGETARTVDAISGAGANSAIADGEAVGELMRNLKYQGWEYARTTYANTVQENTRLAFGYSLFFRDMASIYRKQTKYVQTLMSLVGLSSPRGDGLLDLMKRMAAMMIKPVIGGGDRGRDQSSIIRFFVQNELSMLQVHPPLSSSRQNRIGEVHRGRIYIPVPDAKSCYGLF